MASEGNVLPILICFYKQKLRRAIRSNNANLLYSHLYQHNVANQCPFKRLARSACSLPIEDRDIYADKFQRHRLHPGTTCDSTDADIDHLCLEHQLFGQHLEESGLKLPEAITTSIPPDQWISTQTAALVLESRGINAQNTPFMANALQNKLPSINDSPDNWWEMDEKYLFPQPTQYHSPIDFLCPCLLQCTCAMELSIFSLRSGFDDMPVPSFVPIVCPLVLALQSRNQDIISLFLSRLFTKIRPNILPPLEREDKDGEPQPPEERNVKEPRTLQPYDKEYMAGKMLTLLTLPCKGYVSILVYNYPTPQFRKELREKNGLPPINDDEANDNFMALLFNYYDMPTSLLLRNKRLALFSPAHFLNYCGLEIAPLLLKQPISIMGTQLSIVDSANKRLEVYSSRAYTDMSDYEAKIKLAAQRGICYGPEPEGTPPEDDEDDEPSDDELPPLDEEEDDDTQKIAIPYHPVKPLDDDGKRRVDPDLLDITAPPLENDYWTNLVDSVPPFLRPCYEMLRCIVVDDWDRLGELWEESSRQIGEVQMVLLGLLKRGDELLFLYNSMSKCNTYNIQPMDELNKARPDFARFENISEDAVSHYSVHLMAHLRTVLIGLASGVITLDTQEDKIPLEYVMEVIFSPLYIGDLIFSSTTAVYWKSAICMNKDYDLTLFQELTPFTGINVRGLTYEANEYVMIAMRHDNMRILCTLLYMIIEINGLPTRYQTKYEDEIPILKENNRASMALVCEFVPDLRGLLSTTSLLIIALKAQATNCVLALCQIFPVWAWQQLATWAYTGFTPSEVMRLSRAVAESCPPTLTVFDRHTMEKLTPIFGRYMMALIDNKFDPELLRDDGEALGIVYGAMDRYLHTRQGFYTRGDGLNNITTEYSEGNIHSQRTMLRDIRNFMETVPLQCPFCNAGHSQVNTSHDVPYDGDTIYHLPVGLIDIAIIMGHTSVASSLLLLSMSLRTRYKLTETFLLFGKENITDPELINTTQLSSLTTENSNCICCASSTDEVHGMIPKRYLPYILTRFICSPLLIPSFNDQYSNSTVYIHSYVTATIMDNQDLLHLFASAGFDTLTSTDSHRYAVDPLTATVGSCTTISLRVMFTLIRQRFKRLIMVLYNCARSMASTTLCNDELVFLSAIALPLPIITHSYTKFPLEMFGIRQSESSKNVPLSSRLLMFSHSNVVDYIIYDIVSLAVNNILLAYGVDDALTLKNNFKITPSQKTLRMFEKMREQRLRNDAGEGEQGEGEDLYDVDDDEEDGEDYDESVPLTEREIQTSAFTLALRTSSPWLLYSLLRCVNPALDAYGALAHILDNIISSPEVTIYSNTPFVTNNNADITPPRPLGDDSESFDEQRERALENRHYDLLNAVAAINKMTLAVQLNAKATGDRLSDEWAELYNQFNVGVTVNRDCILDLIDPAEICEDVEDPELEVPHLNPDFETILEQIQKEEEELQTFDTMAHTNLGEDETEEQATRKPANPSQIERTARLIASLKINRYESREPCKYRPSPYATPGTQEVDFARITNGQGKSLDLYLGRGMLSTYPAEKYVAFGGVNDEEVDTFHTLLCGMLHVLNGKTYGVPTGQDNQIMIVPMIALAQRCNSIPAFANIIKHKSQTLFDIFSGYISLLAPEEQKDEGQGHEPQRLSDLLDKLDLEDPERGAHYRASIDNVTSLLGSSVQQALQTMQGMMADGSIPAGGPADSTTDLFSEPF